MKKVLVSFSGGMDSATVLARAITCGHEVIPVGFHYGSKHNHWEQKAAQELLKKYFPDKTFSQIGWRQIYLSDIFSHFTSNLLKTGDDIPEGHYEAENMRLTVVPGRNIIFASILAGLAWSLKCDEVWLGIHAGDHFIYPDCRPSFFNAMKVAIREGTDGTVELEAPYLDVTKKEILHEGMKLRVDYKLTRTCYKDQPIACGKCGSCQERLTAFKALGLDDPLEYESRELMPK